ncbi:MAG: hypothetical protein FJ011_19345 [Chloroflexi bacterium]|nr:hypothetical protein [Chloroflexota bacterium]
MKETSQARLSRRTFLKIGGVTAATAAAAAGTRALLDQSGAVGIGASAVQAAAPQDEKWVRTTCALCPSGCGLEVRVVNGHAVKVEGSAIHPLNQGVCCLRGQAALEMLYSPERIRHPMVKTLEVLETSKVSVSGNSKLPTFREISWEEALGLVAGKLGELRRAGQAHTVGFMLGDARGSLRPLVRQFMTAYGSPNAISLESPDEQTARLAMFLTQGINGYPIYDLNNARYVMTFGGNLLESSRHLITALSGLAFMRRGRPERGKTVAVHPRLALTGVKADEWVPIRPGAYAALALGMANVIISSGLYDKDFVRDYTFGFEDFTDESGASHMGFRRLATERYTLDRVEMITGVPAADIARLAGEFATHRPAVAIMPTEPDGGLDVYAAMAVHALNALIGAIDAAGGVLVQRFPRLADWPALNPDAVAKAGLAQEPIDDGSLPLLTVGSRLADRILAADPYPLNALFILNANPVYEQGDGGRFAAALTKVPFVVSFASTMDETAAHADLILPASTFLEIWGDDFVEGAGYAGVSLRQPVVEPVHDTRNPGDVLLDLAARLGGPVATALPWRSYHELMEYRLAAVDMDRTRFAENAVWSEMVYFHAQPGSAAWRAVVGRDRLSAPQDGRFDFFSRELYAVLDRQAARSTLATDLACLPHFETPVAAADERSYPFLLVTQSLITHPHGWYGILPTLQECYGLQSHVKWSSWVEINPRAGRALGLKDGDLVWVESPTGKVRAPVRLYQGIWPNAVYLPPGLGHQTRVKWGRDSATNIIIGANVNQLRAGDGVTRVKVYKEST